MSNTERVVHSRLHVAATEGRRDIVALLLDRRADAGVRDTAGSTPLHWAAFEGHSHVVEHRRREGAGTH